MGRNGCVSMVTLEVVSIFSEKNKEVYPNGYRVVSGEV